MGCGCSESKATYLCEYCTPLNYHIEFCKGSERVHLCAPAFIETELSAMNMIIDKISRLSSTLC